MTMDYKNLLAEGKCVLGIEFGSTRIKAVLADMSGNPIEFGDHMWENDLKDGIWTYSEDAIWGGLQDAYKNLKDNVKAKYDVTLKSFAAIGFSAMMHGYIALDSKDELLVPFRTWRNTITEEAADKLTEAFDFNIPQRWSISHLYQAILNGEEHVKDISFLTTLAGYVHYKLTGVKALGVGDASGMFPIDSNTIDYDSKMMDIFSGLIKDKNFQKVAEDYKRVIETAKVQPEKFVFQLYEFYKKEAKYIKDNNLTEKYFDFVSQLQELSAIEKDPDKSSVYMALIQILLEQTMFLTQNNLDYNRIVVGVDTDGKIIESDDIYPNLDLPVYEVEKMVAAGQVPDLETIQMQYSRWNYSIDSIEDTEILREQNMYFSYIVQYMIPFVNEYTMDIIPTNLNP